MTDVETLEERVRTVERAVTDGEHGFPAVDDLAELTERVDALEGRVDELHDRAEELEAATQALRGYVGNVRSVNERVEGRADAALAATERLERRLDAVTETRQPPDAGETESGRDPDPGATAAGPRDGADEARVVGARTRGRSGGESGDGDRTDGAGSETSTTDSHDSGVLERVRSLL